MIDYHKRQESELSDRCKGLHSMLQYNLLTYTSQPIPFLGRVDLAAVFLHRRKFASENILFGTFVCSGVLSSHAVSNGVGEPTIITSIHLPASYHRLCFASQETSRIPRSTPAWAARTGT